MLLRGAVVSTFLLVLAPQVASAAQYEIFISVQNEQDLYDLLLAGQISESSFNALLLLHQARVELNRASREQLYLLPNLDYEHVDRILAFRRDTGVIHALGDLTTAGVLCVKLAESLRAFVSIRSPDAPRAKAEGLVRIQGRWSGLYDRLPPAAAVQARIKAHGKLDVGIAAALTRNTLRRVRWDSQRNALSAAPERVRLVVPKLYAQWEGDNWEIVGGTYRIGFGQRLTFDVTDQITPNGFFGDYELRRNNELGLRCRRAPGELLESPCPRDQVARITPDYDWTNRLTGVAVGLQSLSVRDGWLQVYAWGSYQVHRIPQIEVVDAGVCDDPRQDEDATCGVPPVYVRTGDPNEPESTATFATLPAMYAEGLAGANASYFWNARAHLGITGYGSMPKWLVQGVDLGFQETARKPFGGAFGAVGVNAAFGVGAHDLFAEVSRSFDAQAGGGGGYAAIVRSVTTLATTELELSARYYDPHYVNPYARPISAPDELDGLRARDEMGLRMRVTAQLGRRLGLRTLADAWRRFSSGGFNALLSARSDLEISSSWAWSVWTEYRNGAAQRLLLASQLVYDPNEKLSLAGQFLHRWVGSELARSLLQRDLSAVLTIAVHPIDILRVRIRARYEVEDVLDNHRGAQVVWTYLDAAFAVRQRDSIRMRYDVRAFLDRRESTLVRVPNPEHWLWLEYTVRY